MGSESEASFMLEVVDDNIAENEETFILYTNTTESSDDECAVAVTIRDDDCKYMIIYTISGMRRS